MRDLELPLSRGKFTENAIKKSMSDNAYALTLSFEFNVRQFTLNY